MNIYEISRVNFGMQQEVLELEKISGYSIEELKKLFLKGYELQPMKPATTMERFVYDSAIMDIANHYRFEEQKNQFSEETGELLVALNKYRRKNVKKDKNELRKDVLEEIADVEVILDQLKYLLKGNKEVEETKSFKVDRELSRIYKIEPEGVNV